MPKGPKRMLNVLIVIVETPENEALSFWDGIHIY